MPLPSLQNWETTRDALHQATLVVGAIRVASSDAMMNDLQFSLEVIEGGVSSTELNGGGVLKLDFATFTLIYEKDGRVIFKLDASGLTQKSLMDEVLRKLSANGVTLQPSLKHITHDEPFNLDMQLAKAYAKTVDAIFTALARFRAKLAGAMTPLVIWPHHFDMAFIWFATSAMDEHTAPHIMIGFAPFSDGKDRPYFYGYGWSKDTGYVQVEVDDPAQSISEGYTGLYIDYDTLRASDNVNQTLEAILMQYHHRASEMLI